jgi:hypothetical protein
MKKINFKFIGVLLLAVLALGSCKKWIDPNVNVNPDAPTDVDMSLILPYAETNMAYTTVGGNDIARVTGIWMQYLAGMARQSNAEQNYYWFNSDDNNLWNSNYATSMNDLKIIMGKAEGMLKLSPAEQKTGRLYKGMSNVLMALSLGLTTDVWGDVPFVDAFQGNVNLQPKFNTQQEIYPLIQAMLDTAIANFNKPIAGSQSRDLIYGGSGAKWLKAAYALKARYALHLSKQNGTAAYQAALDAINAGAISDNADDMDFVFSAYPYSNPFFNFENERGDVQMHKTFIDMLLLRQDPRIVVFADPNGDGLFVGAGFDYSGDGSDISWPGSAVAYEASPVQFITNTEVQFIKAECLFQTGAPVADVRAALVGAVGASMDKWGVFNPLYMAAYDSVVQTIPDAGLLKEIMTEKYLSLYMQVESFNDWRRTDNLIGLTANPIPGAARHEIPRRYPYPVDEQTYNTNTPTVANIWERVWWDKVVK